SSTVPTLAPVSADLVGPGSAVARIPCRSPDLLSGSYACGPLRTTADPGRWEVHYSGGGLVTAALTLREIG
ncbi:MAG TPA: hypothetical protein VNX21_02795, partial [Candidatus Thermoplasmatota archaeon]|nr:hypothetical protein [Candidatus Thermoplasmatota archaeon]